MSYNYIFTVTTGRSGQETLYKTIKKYTLACFCEFEPPNINPILPSFLGEIEKKIRRKFLEKNELLGRGKVITAFENGEVNYIKNIASRRLKSINTNLAKANANYYFDISKFYARGLHLGFNELIGSYSLVFLVRDPLLNMRSFINRNKIFELDNSLPSAKSNILIMNEKNFSKEEYYLWSWSEIFLRFKEMEKSKQVKKSLVFKTEDLDSPRKIELLLSDLGIQYMNIEEVKKVNTNVCAGNKKTIVKKKDLGILKNFILKVPDTYKELKNELTASLKKNEDLNESLLSDN